MSFKLLKWHKKFECWSTELIKGNYVDIIYFNFTKASDTVSYPKLFTKLKSCGITDTTPHSSRKWLFQLYLSILRSLPRVCTCHYSISDIIIQDLIVGWYRILLSYINDLPSIFLSIEFILNSSHMTIICTININIFKDISSED